MIDLHIHTQYSDGLPTVKEILQLAEERKLDYIAITDHDAIGAYKELNEMNIKEYFSGKIIYGCELKFVYNQTQMELVALGYDWEKLNKSYWVHEESYHANKKALLENALKNGKKAGFVYDELTYNPNEKSEKTFYFELLKHEENLPILEKYKVKHGGDFFRNIVANPDSPLYFDPTKYTLGFEEAVDLIHDCGGVALLAHPFGVYKIDNPKEIINELLAKNKLDGLECYHSSMTEEHTEYLLNLCKEKGLLTSGGSDYHNYPGQQFAKAHDGRKDIPTEIIADILKRIGDSGIVEGSK